jgi:HlyD family secretion protein
MIIQRKENRGLRFLVIILITAVAVIASGILNRSTSAQSPGFNGAKTAKPITPSAASPPAKKILAYAVATGQVQRELVLTGELRAARSMVINAPDIWNASASMITFLAPEGSQIKKGERIVEFDDSSLLSILSEAQRTLDEADLKIAKTKADLEAQRCDLLNSLSQAESQLKQDQLYGKISKDLLPGNTYQKYQLNVEKSMLSLQKAREQLDNFEKSYEAQMSLVQISKSKAEVTLKRIENAVSLLKIDAPQDGILIYGDNWISNRKIQVGDSAMRGMEVASLPDLYSMQVVGHVYDTEYSSLAREMPCIVSFDALPGFRIGGKIASLSSVGARKSFASQKKVFQAIIELDKVESDKLKPGMTARINIPIVLAKDVLVVPREYLGVDTQGRDYVLKGTDAKSASVQFITLGAIGNRVVQVASGLSKGDSLLPVQQ